MTDGDNKERCGNRNAESRVGEHMLQAGRERERAKSNRNGLESRSDNIVDC